MKTSIDKRYQGRAEVLEAEEILRSCVHCGFCTATCPTYQLLGNELDSPRGRIYLIKDMLEGYDVSASTQLHLDRCLTCYSCETTCPSGVRYGRLIDIGRSLVEQRVPRSLAERLKRWLLLSIVPYSIRMNMLLSMGRLFKPIMPRVLKNKIPTKRTANTVLQQQLPRTMLVLNGCVQPLTTPHTNAAATRVLTKLGVALVSAPNAGCCGALAQHLSATEQARQSIRNNLDAWWPFIENGIEAIVMTASGCGMMVKEYGELLKDDPRYALKAKRVSELTRDIGEILSTEDLSGFAGVGKGTKVAFQAPCSLQHGQKITGTVEAILQRCGYTLTEVPDGHLCCGSAGSYSLLQPEISQKLLANKLLALNSGGPDVIATANIGCQMHLETCTERPVKHWIELLDAG